MDHPLHPVCGASLIVAWRWWFERIYRRGNAPWDSGITPPEVVELLDLTEVNQRVLLHRARAKVRQALEDYLGGAR